MNFLKWSFFVGVFSFKGLLASPPDVEVLETSHRINGSLMDETMGVKKAEVLDLLWGLYRNDKLISHGIMVNAKGYLLSKASSSMGARYAKSFSGKYLPFVYAREMSRPTLLSGRLQIHRNFGHLQNGIMI